MSTQDNELINWQDALLPLGSTLQQAIHCLENSSLQIVLVTTDGDKLAGTLSDGDIRRAFLNGLGLDCKIDEAIHRNPLAVPPSMGRELVMQLMKINKIKQLPIVNQENVIVGLHVWDSVSELGSLPNILLIMAGGKGTRLRPHTENCPKPMLEVSGKPMLEHIVTRARDEGFRNFVISVHYLGHMIEEYFGDGSLHGVKIDYLREKSSLGTAGCLSLFNPRPELPFIVTNGDVLTDINYREILNFHVRHNAAATMTVRHYEWKNPFGVVKTNGIELVGFEEKPVYKSHINAGIYALSPSYLELLAEEKYCDMPTLFARIQEKQGRTIVYPMHEPWLDIGRPEDLHRANMVTNALISR